VPQAAEAVHYIHQKGVIRPDLRPDNFLLQPDSKCNLDLLLCDFGGLKSGDLDGGHRPDSGLFNPCRPFFAIRGWKRQMLSRSFECFERNSVEFNETILLKKAQ
jgi:serine/threonine protein kinase